MNFNVIRIGLSSANFQFCPCGKHTPVYIDRTADCGAGVALSPAHVLIEVKEVVPSCKGVMGYNSPGLTKLVQSRPPLVSTNSPK
jgi:hypothetical protein